MRNNALISEKAKVSAEILAITSAAGATSLNYDMQQYKQALFTANVSGNFSTVTIDLMESSGATVAGSSALGSKVGMVVGGPSTLIPVTGGVRKMTLTMSAASTDLEYFTLLAGSVSKKFVYTTSTALHNSSAQTSSALYFGSTVGCTVNTGMALSLDSLKSAIASTLAFGNSLVLSTGSTATLTITAGDAVAGNLGLSASAVMDAEVNQAVGAFNLAQDEIDGDNNKRWVSIKASTASTACDVAVTVIRTGGNYRPPVFAGKLSTVNFSS